MELDATRPVSPYASLRAARVAVAIFQISSTESIFKSRATEIGSPADSNSGLRFLAPSRVEARRNVLCRMLRQKMVDGGGANRIDLGNVGIAEIDEPLCEKAGAS
ncbi:hypothetical protein JIR23_03545 [Bradyrhizobium diazoefficiens]|nr:hypothetical protein [Bradyrhizobium diazoefficiens]QQN64904.1 hypothetical protein JIR23_03545 [Bradyrhizobium diazoefficiens]